MRAWLILLVVVGASCGDGERQGPPSDAGTAPADLGPGGDGGGDAGNGGADGVAPGDDAGEVSDAGAPDVAGPSDTQDAADAGPQAGDAGPLPVATGPINGWILLDDDLAAVFSTIDAAAAFGVNHIQLSHGLIMNIEDVLPGAAGADARVETLNAAIERAHAHGMKAYVWAHELSGDPPNPAPCWGPDGAIWAERAAAYRDGIARIPSVDGVILMFGSAPVPPWIAICSCAWCDQFTEGGPWDHPPQAMKLELITEHVGGAIVGELGKELFVRTFIHEPVEVPWHSQGLSAADGVPFVGMHKGEAQDWHPYNPPDPNVGQIGEHEAVVELDLAGEYQGLSELPFVAPGYFRERLRHVREAGGIGAVARVQRGSHHALGTPNEINLRAVAAWSLDPSVSLETAWSEALAAMYGVSGGDAAALRRVLEHTFSVRLKSHYALGIWALEKSSDLPGGAKMEELNGRGNLPKWDPTWQPVWDRVASPDREAVEWIWQEGTEAVELALGDLGALDGVALSAAHREDLDRRLLHQWWAARAWRAADLLLFGRKALNKTADDGELAGWLVWAHAELQAVADGMTADGLAGVSVASPARIAKLRAATEPLVPKGVDAVEPDTHLFSPVEAVELLPTTARVRFTTRRPVDVVVEWGAALPDLEESLPLGAVEAETPTEVTLTGLTPGSRWFVRLRAVEGGAARRGGEWWLFTP
ncbi:MAG: hypothetical protein AMXMBFR64_30880 [Myxococcales bacterium]